MSDYISREAAFDSVFHQFCASSDETESALNAAIDEIKAIPAADVRPVVRGKWGYRWKIHGDGRRPTELFPCSECGYENTSATNFCPNCGADMKEES